VSTRTVIESFWEAMEANDWDAAAALFADDASIEYACSGERIKSPQAWAEIQRQYPVEGRWHFAVHRVLVDGGAAVSEATVTDDGEQANRVIAFSEVEGDRITRQVEYWPDAYEPPTGRAHLVDRIDPIP